MLQYSTLSSLELGGVDDFMGYRAPDWRLLVPPQSGRPSFAGEAFGL